MIVITAATGTFGPLVVEKLLERGAAPKNIAVAVRNPQKANTFAEKGVTVRQADYNDPAALETAFADTDRLLFISSPEFDTQKRVAQHERVITAAQRAGVGSIVYTSFVGAEAELPGGLNAHFLTERKIKESGLPFTFLRNAFYTEGILPPSYLQAAVATGELKSAAGHHGVNTARRAELAEAAVTVLLGQEHVNKAYELVGTPWTFPQIADLLTQRSGHLVRHQEVPPQELGPLGFLHPLFRSGAFETTSPDLEYLLGRSLLPIEHYLSSALTTGAR